MESIFNSFPVGLILRSFIPGIFSVASFLLATEGWDTSMKCHDLTTLLIASAVSGVVIYSFYRSLVYPILEARLERDPKKASCCPLIKKETVDRLIYQWSLTGKKYRSNKFGQRVAAWADYTHLQYASALGIGLGAAFGHFKNPSAEIDYTIGGVAVLLFVSAFLSDWRLRTVLIEIQTRFPDNGGPTAS